MIASKQVRSRYNADLLLKVQSQFENRCTLLDTFFLSYPVGTQNTEVQLVIPDIIKVLAPTSSTEKKTVPYESKNI